MEISDMLFSADNFLLPLFCHFHFFHFNFGEVISWHRSSFISFLRTKGTATIPFDTRIFKPLVNSRFFVLIKNRHELMLHIEIEGLECPINWFLLDAKFFFLFALSPSFNFYDFNLNLTLLSCSFFHFKFDMLRLGSARLRFVSHWTSLIWNIKFVSVKVNELKMCQFEKLCVPLISQFPLKFLLQHVTLCQCLKELQIRKHYSMCGQIRWANV